MVTGLAVFLKRVHKGISWHWSGGCAAWGGCEEIPHFQGQRSPSKMLGTEVAAVQYWSYLEKIPHVQGQR